MNAQGQNHLLRFWLARLQEEYSAICHDHGVGLRPPVFEISATKRQMGCWQSKSRSMKISKTLIASYPWATTLQVLRHEMAHQYCTEVMGDKSSGHGESFQQACEILGVLPQFRRAELISEEFLQNLDKHEDGGSSTGILAKIDKLLALGESPNVHEAELALEKAYQLIDKYQIEQLGQAHHDNYTVLVIETGSRQMATYRRLLCTILQDYFYVRVVVSEAYIPALDSSQKTIELLGTRENTMVAEHCYYYLENNLELLWRSFRVTTGAKGKRAKNSYYLGVLTGFYQKLEKQAGTKEPAKKEKKELMLLEDRRLSDFLHMCFPRLVRSGSRRSTVNKDAYEQGKQEGKRLTLNSGVGDGAPGKRYLE